MHPCTHAPSLRLPHVLLQVRLVAQDTVEAKVLDMQRWKLQRGQAPAASAAEEFDGGTLMRFFGNL